MRHRTINKPLLRINRLESLTDGVFAISMTILVLGITVPTLHRYPKPLELLAALRSIWPAFFHYGLSFLILGRVWIALTHLFDLIEYTDRTHLYLNLLILMFAGLIPFSTSLIADYPGIYVAEFLFHINMLLLGLAIYGQLRYAIRGRGLSKETLDKKMVSQLELLNLTLPALALIGIMIAIWHPRWSTAPYFLLLVIPSFLKGDKLHDAFV